MSHPVDIRASGVSEALNHELEGLLIELASMKQVGHAVMAVESGDRALRWTAAAGFSTPLGDPMLADTPFFIASVDKMYIAAATLRLCERGKIHLEERISAYLPSSLVEGLHRLGGVDYSNQLTVHHLLSHTSGLADYLEDRPKGGRSLLERLIEEGDMDWTVDEMAAIVREDLTPHFPPQDLAAKRQKARYCDTNFMLLIAILEAVTGQSQKEAFTEMLFRPLGLQSTFFDDPAEAPGQALPAAALWFGARPLDLPMAMRALRSIYSSAGDLLTFLRALVGGKVFDDPAVFGLMTRRWNRFAFPLDQAALRAPGWPIEYGLGMMRFRLPRFFTPLAPIPEVIGHTGSTGSWLFYCPSLDLYLCGTVDQGTAGALPYRLTPRLLRLLEAASR